MDRKKTSINGIGGRDNRTFINAGGITLGRSEMGQSRGVEIDSKEFQIDLSASGFTIESSFFP
jgi:hypothetical protein